jgi:hypothetical protein
MLFISLLREAFRTVFYTQNLVKIHHQAFIPKLNAKIMATLSQLFISGKKSRLNLNQKFLTQVCV